MWGTSCYSKKVQGDAYRCATRPQAGTRTDNSRAATRSYLTTAGARHNAGVFWPRAYRQYIERTRTPPTIASVAVVISGTLLFQSLPVLLSPRLFGSNSAQNAPIPAAETSTVVPGIYLLLLLLMMMMNSYLLVAIISRKSSRSLLIVCK